ncbi:MULTISPECIES: heavy metal translocating P-type ATPase [Helicobacter]|uniref:P-type Zn(2+) transporter n=1 Tax=Helicobacter ibis TaxID=2962633 RepID=A0ABT4VEV0_9HELI|nr:MULTISPECIES: heavy metal translocating P-type ATPase [Helicobacter]MDA3967114.1 heavy metal translocating P-type ATPase [Helicobacter sp. WB40]MDA3969242.1 heavy metal translocating P-type ATPase [Helicobacter ibis]
MEGCCNSGCCGGKKERASYRQILFIASSTIYVCTLGIDFMKLDVQELILSAIYLFCYFALGYEILKEAFLGLVRKEFFNENSLMAIASIGAWIIGDGAEAVAILLFYRVGESLESLIVEKSKQSIRNLSSLKIESVKILQNNEIQEKDPKDIKIDDILVVLAGDRIPADGVIIKGESSIDNSALNGESLPQSVKSGDSLLSGGINLEGTLHIKATKSYEDSAFSKIIKLIEEGQAQKSKSEEFIRKFARLYTPIVTLLALGIVIFPTLYEVLFLDSVFLESFKTWLYRGIIFLVVSCPCALVISIPLTFFASLGRASKEGILIKGSSYLETLNSVNAIVFDKTGTLTKGELRIKEIYLYSKYDKEFVLKIAKSLENNSNHPIAKAIQLSQIDEILNIDNIKESAGGGISGTYNGVNVAVGNARYIESIIQKNIEVNTDSKCQVFVAYDLELICSIELEDELKNEAVESIKELQSYELYMLSGDRENIAKEISNIVGIKNYYAELLPSDKVTHLKSIIKEQSKNHKRTIFVGDGINDAPSLALSDVGIAMGKGSDVALEGADVVILNDDLKKIPKLLKIAKKTRTILWQNIIFALGVKAGIMILGAFGVANLWVALFGDVGVALLALLNAIRAIR